MRSNTRAAALLPFLRVKQAALNQPHDSQLFTVGTSRLSFVYTSTTPLLRIRVAVRAVVLGADHCHVEVLLQCLGVALAHVLHEVAVHA